VGNMLSYKLFSLAAARYTIKVDSSIVQLRKVLRAVSYHLSLQPSLHLYRSPEAPPLL